MAARGISPPPECGPVRMSQGTFREFDDFPRLIELGRSGLLGHGARLARIGYRMCPTPDTATVTADRHTLIFPDQHILAAPQPSTNTDMAPLPK